MVISADQLQPAAAESAAQSATGAALSASCLNADEALAARPLGMTW
jgi:hypothetical protein